MSIRPIKIGLYDADHELIGYKVDTFWHVSKTEWKSHLLENGDIPVHIIRNLQSVLNFQLMSEKEIQELDGLSQLGAAAEESTFGKLDPDAEILVGWSYVEGSEPIMMSYIIRDSRVVPL